MFETSMPDSDNRILFGQNIIQIVHHINSSCLVILTCHTITQREYDSMKERLMVKHGYRVLLECGGGSVVSDYQIAPQYATCRFIRHYMLPEDTGY